MMRRLILLLAVMGCEAKKEQQSAPASSSVARPSACGDEVITDKGIGELQIGATVEAIRQKCDVVRDTTALDSEGMPARKLSVALSRDTVEAEIVDGRLWRIAVHSPRLRTADSLGVGIPLSRLLRLRNPRGMAGEGKFFVASPEHCGMSFRLASTGPGAQRGDMDGSGLRRLPPSTAVSEVLVFGCRPS